MSKSFNDQYAQAYDLLNSGKPYSQEVEFLQKIFTDFSSTKNAISSVLDLGCGSGMHLSFFAPETLKVGVDFSSSMLDKASKLNLSNSEFTLSKIQNFKSSTKFDLVFSLFHVISYQITDRQLRDTFIAIENSLSKNGIAIFDFWHRPAWDFDPPVTRITQRNNETLNVVRVSRPLVDGVEGTVAIDMDLFIRNTHTKNGLYQHHTEHHIMRAFTLSELRLVAEIAGLQIVAVGPWMSQSREISSTDWYGWMALSKMQAT